MVDDYLQNERTYCGSLALLEKGPLGFPIPSTWWLIPLSKWVITPVINGISRVNPLITGVITHLLSGNEPPSRDDEKTVGYAMPVYCHNTCTVVFRSNSDCCCKKPPLKSLNWFGKYLP